MDISDVISFANHHGTANQPEALLDATVFRDGRTGAPAVFVAPDPSFTEYLWYSGPEAMVGITDPLDTDAQIVGVVDGANILASDSPLSLELDPDPAFPFGIVPYDLETTAKVLLSLWFKLPAERPLFSRMPNGDIWRVDHEGAFDLRCIRITPEGIGVRAGLNILSEDHRSSAIRIVASMLRGNFLHEEEAAVLIEDLTRNLESDPMADIAA